MSTLTETLDQYAKGQAALAILEQLVKLNEGSGMGLCDVCMDDHDTKLLCLVNEARALFGKHPL